MHNSYLSSTPSQQRLWQKLFFDNVIKLHEVPRTIVSDRDKVFTSQFWKELFTLLGTKLLLSSAYHPQTDGQTERVNQYLEMYLRCAVYDDPKKWKSWLSQAEFWYNSAYHTSVGCTPFFALYGYEANTGLVPSHPTQSTTVSEEISTLQQQAVVLKEHLATAQNKMKMAADKKRNHQEYQVAELVLLKLQPYTQSSLVNRPFPKLAFKYFGPYKVLERIGRAAYKLELPADCLIHPVFHVSQLKSFTPDHTPVFSELSHVPDLTRQDLLPEGILERRLVKKGGKAIPQVWVKWTSLPPGSATWEDWNVITRRFPGVLTGGPASS